VKRLIDIVSEKPKRLVAPLMGYPGARLTGSTIRQNLFNPELHYRSVAALVERFSPDVAFFFMDLAVEAGALGLPVRFPLNDSPTVEAHPVQTVEDLEQFKALDPLRDVRLQGFVETMRLMSKGLTVLKGAYVTGPFTLVGHLMGASKAAVATLKKPELVHALAKFASEVIASYAQELVRAGADLLAILEPTATILSPDAFATFSGRYVTEIVDEISVPTVLHICGEATHLVPKMCETGVDGLSLDAAVPFAEIASKVPENIVLIGNIDPVNVMLNGSPEEVRAAVCSLLKSVEGHENFILSTGCDLPLETPFENIQMLVKGGKGYC